MALQRYCFFLTYANFRAQFFIFSSYFYGIHHYRRNLSHVLSFSTCLIYRRCLLYAVLFPPSSLIIYDRQLQTPTHAQKKKEGWYGHYKTNRLQNLAGFSYHTGILRWRLYNSVLPFCHNICCGIEIVHLYVI